MSGKTPTVALAVIGAEVLSGKVRDENGPHLIDELRSLGARLGEVRVIDDGVPIIADTVSTLASRFDYLITTGGIGPTHDDMTVAGVAKAFSVAVIRDPGLEQMLRSHYGDRMTENHLRLAEVPEGAQVHSPKGSVPVLQMRNVFILPGVPKLMRACFSQISETFRGPRFVTHVLHLDASESAIADVLSEAASANPGVQIGSYPRFDGGPARVKVTVEATDRALVEATVAHLRATLPEGSFLESREESVL
ncbi:MAG: molybdopterin-binding protein [Myxococcota bacterium]